jgi:hypothetical protein
MIVALSQRNLLSLLHKLQMPGSVCAVIKGDGTVLVAEPDELHYRGRTPGEMHPETEKFVAEMELALKHIRRKHEAPNTVTEWRDAPMWVRVAAREIADRFTGSHHTEAILRVISHYAKEAN